MITVNQIENHADIRIFCDCGTNFYIYEPDSIGTCPNCEKIYTILVSKEE